MAQQQQAQQQQLPEQSGGFLGLVDSKIDWLNSSKYFAGVMMLLLNLGSKYISLDLSESQEKFLSNHLFRRFLIFVVFFIATRDIKISLVSTALFVILVMGIFNEDSKYCLIPSVKDNTKITKEEFKLAQTIMGRYQQQQQQGR